MLTKIEKQQLKDFRIARIIALEIEPGLYRRAKNGERITNYCGFKDKNGNCYVVGDSLDDIHNPDCYLEFGYNKLPARVVFREITSVRL
jgi:hypothetical protein